MKPIINIAVIIAAVFSTACGQPPAGLADNIVVSTKSGDAKFRVETIVSGLEVPWGFAFLPNGDMLVTERPGRVRLISAGKLRAEPVYKVPDVEPSSESGLMDISVHPEFAKNGFVYIAYAYRDDGKRVKVVRHKYSDNAFADAKTIIDSIPAAPNHAGTRSRFGPDGKLYVTTGDATDWELAQKTDSLAGKTLRLNDDGTVPADNPFVADKSYRPEIWSVGHRNAQGLAWSKDGTMFQNEHGPSGFEGRGGGADEVNLVEKGKNYGWPEVYRDMKKDGMESPLVEYTPACAPGGLAVYYGDKFPAFNGNLFVTCLRGKRIVRIVMNGRAVASQENLLEGKLGRIREIAVGPDGNIYFSTSNRDGRGDAASTDDRIMRIVKSQ